MRWIVDGMNVIGCRPDGWWRDRRGAIDALVERLDRWAQAHDADVTVVFEQPLTPPPDAAGIRIAYAPRASANSADDEIVRLVSADAHPQDLLVVTSDRTLTERVVAAGASVHPAARFRDEIDPGR
ncbi:MULTISPECIES: NYN domain-containing protein [Mycobacteriaceae]|uniref:NYN domain-containing protein n=1 Tax=Mycobacteriaceae TaxID=1762 RepID=UPI0007FD9CD1|nr:MULTISPECIES: NYN domain-containing protein [Mycobacteriaceae]MCK0177411.1 NYN domain-containing protein [Mycolicibacterium sp. F2034L]OBB58399.1 RNA-binding protein [Mycobacterium sp. 852013-51886_SCH5428379]